MGHLSLYNAAVSRLFAASGLKSFWALERPNNIAMLPAMTKHCKILTIIAALGLSLGLTLPATAQSTNSPAPANGGTYVKETHGDWEIRCIRLPDTSERCQMFQLLNESPGNAIGEINIFALPPDQEAAAGAILLTPLRTLLTEQVSIKFPGLERKRYPFAWCTDVGCIARIGLLAAEVSAMRQGASTTVTIVPVSTPTNPVEMTVSLTGFTAAFAAMIAANPG